MGEKDGEARKIKDHLDAHNGEKERELGRLLPAIISAFVLWPHASSMARRG